MSIAVKDKPRHEMRIVESAHITQQHGVDKDARGRPSNRQVSILSSVQWQQACDELGVDLPWTFRRANILIDEFQFNSLCVGKEVKIGKAILKITEETDPCHRMDEQHQGLTQALTPNWRGGVCCRVIHDGEIRIGDSVEVI